MNQGRDRGRVGARNSYLHLFINPDLSRPARSLEASERLFSAAKDACPDDRGRLLATTMEKRVCTQQWLKDGVRGGAEWEKTFGVLDRSTAKFTKETRPLA